MAVIPGRVLSPCPTSFTKAFQEADTTSKPSPWTVDNQLLPAECRSFQLGKDRSQENLSHDEQLKQAFYEGMPAIWKERFVNSGSRLTEMARAEVIRYFRDQERQAFTRQRNQDAHPRRFKTKKRPPTESAKPTSSKSSYGSKSSNQSHQHKRHKGHVADDAPCPVHPGSGHTWNDCRANHFGKHHKSNPT
ncbi:hypothetical protein IV203_012810 [Nitzschia inconspicua]|uniref:Uncharacterized protein n=1 Tax=Nitzschia inconspicua TaxID=303405 RepID=A0A9K3M4T1_9STRA|nr:hypothetical protein IV203_012810 [Nitzschia inconspicua]